MALQRSVRGGLGLVSVGLRGLVLKGSLLSVSGAMLAVRAMVCQMVGSVQRSS